MLWSCINSFKLKLWESLISQAWTLLQEQTNTPTAKNDRELTRSTETSHIEQLGESNRGTRNRNSKLRGIEYQSLIKYSRKKGHFDGIPADFGSSYNYPKAKIQSQSRRFPSGTLEKCRRLWILGHGHIPLESASKNPHIISNNSRKRLIVSRSIDEATQPKTNTIQIRSQSSRSKETQRPQ